MNLKQLTKEIEEYNRVVYPKVVSYNKKLNLLLTSSTLKDEEKANVLLIGDNKWYTGCHQWYLRIHIDVYNDTIKDIISNHLWNIPLNTICSFEELYQEISKLLYKPYITQLTIYDVALRLAIGRRELRLLPKEYVYIHAKPRITYGNLYKSHLVSLKPNGWNIQVPICVFEKHFKGLKSYEPYIIEDFLCFLAKIGY